MSFITSAGLVSYINSLNTAAPNAAAPVADFRAIGSLYANIDVALVPKGAGSVLVNIPDNTAAGGNKRGTQAVDLQTVRAFATQVASANNSTIGGGRSNTASGQYSTVPGGTENGATFDYSTVGGGGVNAANAIASCVPGGIGATARGVKGALAYGGNGVADVASQGFSQLRDIVYRSSTADATATPLTTDNAGVVSSTNVAVMSADQAAAFSGQIIAVGTATENIHAWRIEGLIKRPSNAASVVLVASTVTDLGSDAGAAAWTVALAADVTVGGLRITITGAAGTAINWSGVVRFSEVAHF